MRSAWSVVPSVLVHSSDQRRCPFHCPSSPLVRRPAQRSRTHTWWVRGEFVIVDLARAAAALSMALEQDVGPVAASAKRVVLRHDPSIVIVGTGFLSPG